MESNDFKLDIPDFIPESSEPVSEDSHPESETTPLFPEGETPVQTDDTDPAPADSALTENSCPEIADISARLDALNEKFDARIAYDEYKNALFDKMYGELATYKTDIYAKLLKPLILSVASMLDEASAFIERAKSEEPDPQKMKKYISNLAMDLEEMLEVNGVELYEDPSEIFNPSTQRVVGQEITHLEYQDNQVCQRCRRGYRWNGVILRPEMVKIYKYKPAQII